jgi:SAM-dependent methyltransferase
VNDQDARPSGAPAPPTKIGLDDVTRRRLDEIRRRLVFFRSWNLFRYLHLRQAFLETSGVDSVLSVGCGRGLAELALAVEFPDVQIQLTEVDSDALAMTRPVSELAEAWKLENLTFGIQDVLEPLQNRADLVCAVDVLSQVEDDVLAASHLRAASDGYVFCLVPFATGAAQADERLRSRAWEKRRSYRVGYSEDDLRALFPGQSIVRGCFWSHSGARVQATMAALDEAALLPRTAELCEAAECDLEKRVPRRHREALGIWILARSAGG